MVCLAVRSASARSIKDAVDAVNQHSILNTADGLEDLSLAWRIGMPHYDDNP